MVAPMDGWTYTMTDRTRVLQKFTNDDPLNWGGNPEHNPPRGKRRDAVQRRGDEVEHEECVV